MMQIRFVIRREKNVRARDTRAVTKDDESDAKSQDEGSKTGLEFGWIKKNGLVIF